MRTVEEHRAAVLERITGLPALDVPLLDSLGLRLAEPVTAAWPLPPFDSAAIVGYAVRAHDCFAAQRDRPVHLDVVDDVPAGYRASVPVAPGTAIRIGAGAPLPEGADAIVGVDGTDDGRAQVGILGPVARGSAIRRAGSEVAGGAVVLEPGVVVGPREVALLAATGLSRVPVRPRPRVVVISTGTELVEPGAALTPGLIADASGYMLTAAATEAGAIAFRAGPVTDEPKALLETLNDQLVRADLVVTTGGVAADTYDTVRSVLARLGSVRFTRVAVSPGSAQGHGHLGADQVPIFTLPGSPLSAFVAFELFVRPVIRCMLGHEPGDPGVRSATLDSPIEGHPTLRRYVPARAMARGDDLHVAEVTAPGLLGLGSTDVLIVVPAGTERIHTGATVQVLMPGTP